MEYSVDKPPTQKQYLMNMEEKMLDKEFLDDIYIILRQGIEYDNEEAWRIVKSNLIEKL